SATAPQSLVRARSRRPCPSPLGPQSNTLLWSGFSMYPTHRLVKCVARVWVRTQGDPARRPDPREVGPELMVVGPGFRGPLPASRSSELDPGARVAGGLAVPEAA